MLLQTLAMLMMLPPFLGLHAWQHRLDHPELRAHIELEGEFEVFVGGLQRRAAVHKARAVEQHVQRRQAAHQLVDGGLVEHVQRQRGDVGHALIAFQQLRVHVGGPDLRALGRQRQHAGAPYALARRRDQCFLSFKSHHGGNRRRPSYRVLPDVGPGVSWDY
jgi:hypothetical protein